MKLYRAMKMAADGLPEVGRSKRMLGVRTGTMKPNNDVHAVSDSDLVIPGIGGMSAAPNDPMNLPVFLRPSEFGGSGKDPVWELDEADLSVGLVYRRDKPTHGMIEPAPGATTTLAEYEAAIHATRGNWRLVNPSGRDSP